MKRNIFFLIFLFLLSSCGKKQKNIFDFSKKRKVIKVSKFSLGCVKNLKIEKVTPGVKLSWSKFLFNSDNNDISFVGYNVYRLSRSGILPKRPLNSILIQNNFFYYDFHSDKSMCNDFIQKEQFYVVVPVFKVDNRFVNGLLSSVACFKL